MTRQDTIRRLMALQHQVGALIQELKDEESLPPATANSKEYFDPENPTHLAEVNKLFDRYQLNERRRGWFMNRGLQGVRMFDLADVVDRETKAYEVQYPRYTRAMAMATRAQRRH